MTDAETNRDCPTRAARPAGGPAVLVLVGATATGKSSLALELARTLPLEIVNLDASQFYVGMDIGTAKPTAAERAQVPHHLFDVAPPDRPLDAGRYVELADETIRDVCGRGRMPLFVGGTGLYARALLWGRAVIPSGSPGVWDQVALEMEEHGGATLHARLAEVDPAAAARVSVSDRQRISRALEVFCQTGLPISSFQECHGFARARLRYLKLGLRLDPRVLRARITRRVEVMFQEGFVAEVERLLAAGYNPRLRTFKALGYREVVRHLEGGLELEEVRARLVRHHLRYAKRQRTWFSKERDIEWLAFPDRHKALGLAGKFCAANLRTD